MERRLSAFKWSGTSLDASYVILFTHTSHNYFESMLYNAHFIDEEHSQSDLLKVTVRNRSL